MAKLEINVLKSSATLKILTTLRQGQQVHTLSSDHRYFNPLFLVVFFNEGKNSNLNNSDQAPFRLFIIINNSHSIARNTIQLSYAFENPNF